MKLYKITLLVLTSLLLLVSSCTSEVPLNSNFEPQIFISGNLINGTNHMTINIQRTVDVDDLGYDPINNANISLFTKNQSEEISLVTNNFVVTNGEYKTSTMITTIVGNSYWIEITLTDGTILKSDAEILKEPIIINEITRINEFTRVHFNDPFDTNFYLMHFEFSENGEDIFDTWELTNDIFFNGGENSFYEIDELVTGEHLNIKVSIRDLNFNTYQFYLNAFSQFENQIEDGDSDGDPGLLFLPPPANLTGNITNVSNNKRVLGFFGVFSYNEMTKQF